MVEGFVFLLLTLVAVFAEGHRSCNGLKKQTGRRRVVRYEGDSKITVVIQAPWSLSKAPGAKACTHDAWADPV